MDDADVIPCWCPRCNGRRDEPGARVPPGERAGPWVEGRLLRPCTACLVQGLVDAERMVRRKRTP